MKIKSLEEVKAWWKTASDEDRTLFVRALIEEMGSEEFYLMLVDQAGGEEELAEMLAEQDRKASLS